MDGRVVEQKPRLEIVRAVDEHVHARAQPLDVSRVDVGDDRLDGDLGIGRAEFFGRGDRLGKALAGVALVEEDLALEVGPLDDVAIDDSHAADAGADEGIGRRAAQCPAAADQARLCRSRYCPASPMAGNRICRA